MKAKKQAELTLLNDGKDWQMWGVPLFGRGMREALKMISDSVISDRKKPYWIATVNTEFLIEARKDRSFFNLLQKTDLNVVDGIGLIWAKKIQGLKSKWQKLERGFETGVEILQGKHREWLIPGVDLMDEMCGLAEERGWSVYFYGGWEDRSEKTARFLLKKYPKLKVAGYRAEDFDFKTKADFLFVARAMRKQEEWIETNLDKLKVKAVMGVGRSFDYYSGELKRAPEWVQRLGLEWLYSLYKEPKRWRRQLALPKFIWQVVWGQ